jgi:hypothetical protein
VLPGAAVTLSSVEGGVGGNQETVTDARGAYQFLRLVPGTYIVRAQLQGFRPGEQRDIVVSADATSRADLMLPIGQLEEGVVVSGEAPLLDTTSALKQTVLTQEILQALPNRVDVWSVTRMIPSVVATKVDVGGSESFQQSRHTVHGSADEGGYYLDGMNVSGTDDRGDGATFYPDPYAYAEINYVSGGAPADIQRGGFVFNVIPRTGTNQFRGSVQYYGTNRSLNFDNTSSALKEQLLRNIPARIRAAKPDLLPVSDIRYLYDTGAWVGGPIRRDKLWVAASFHHQQVLQHLLGSFNPDGTQVPDDNFLVNGSITIDWQVTRNSQLSYFYTMQRKVNGHRGSTTSFVESGATTRNDKKPQVNRVKWTKPFSAKLVIDAASTLSRVSDTNSWPKEASGDAIAGFDQVTNTVLRILPVYRTDHMSRVVAQTAMSYFTSVHDIKVGAQLDHALLAPEAFSSSGMRAVYRNGVPDSVNTYTTPTFSSMKNREVAVYVQDKWRVTRKLTMNLGLRLDTNYGWVNATCRPQTPFMNAECYAARKGVPDWSAVNPRFSAIYDVTGDGRTAIKIAANRYVVPVGVSIQTRVNPIAVVNDTRPWTACAPGQTSACDLNRDLLPQVNELGPSSGYPLGVNQRYADGYRWPSAQEYTVELQRQLPSNMVATVGYTHRVKGNVLGSRNVAAPSSSYIPVTVTEVNSGRTVTVYNLDPALRGKTELVWDNESALDSTYNGVDITLNRRMSNRWMLFGGVSLGKNVGWVGNTDLNNPNSQEFSRGIFGNDVPFSLRMSGLYALPYGVSISGTLQHQNGFPELTTVSVGNNTIALTQGTTTIIVEPRGTTRLPRLNQLDLSVRKSIRAGTRVFHPRIDFYNVTNSATILSRTTVLGPGFGAVNSIQRGMLIKLGMSVDF